MRGSPAHVGGFSALLGLLGTLGLAYVEGPLFPLAFVSCILGLIGAWELGKHRAAGSLAFLAGGLFPFVSSLLLYQLPPYDSLLAYFLLLWWCPILILAGFLGFLNLPSRPVSQDNAEEVVEEK